MKKTHETCYYDSSMIIKSDYIFAESRLIVEFKGGTQYSFNGVSIETYKSFSEAESIGKSFNEVIKPLGGTKITSDYE